MPSLYFRSRERNSQKCVCEMVSCKNLRVPTAFQCALFFSSQSSFVFFLLHQNSVCIGAKHQWICLLVSNFTIPEALRTRSGLVHCWLYGYFIAVMFSIQCAVHIYNWYSFSLPVSVFNFSFPVWLWYLVSCILVVAVFVFSPLFMIVLSSNCIFIFALSLTHHWYSITAVYCHFILW